MLASWSFDGSKIDLDAKAGGDNLEFYIRNNEWRMDEFRVRKNQKKYDCAGCDAPYPDVSYYFVLTRNPAYYILT